VNDPYEAMLWSKYESNVAAALEKFYYFKLNFSGGTTRGLEARHSLVLSNIHFSNFWGGGETSIVTLYLHP